jgi:hypothetical protein
VFDPENGLHNPATDQASHQASQDHPADQQEHFEPR